MGLRQHAARMAAAEKRSPLWTGMMTVVLNEVTRSSLMAQVAADQVLRAKNVIAWERREFAA